MEQNEKPLLLSICSSRGKRLATEAVQTAVSQELENNPIEYGELVSIHYRDDGSVVSLQTNSDELAAVAARLTIAANNELAEIPDQEISIAVGNFTGVECFSGKGPRLSYMMSPNAYTKAYILNEFEEAGINQTRHSILIRFETTMNISVGAHTTGVTIYSTVPLAETILLGIVPSSFTDIQKETLHEES